MLRDWLLFPVLIVFAILDGSADWLENQKAIDRIKRGELRDWKERCERAARREDGWYQRHFHG